MEWIPAPTPINEKRRAQAVEKTGIIGTNQIYLFDIYLEIAKDISGYSAGSFSLYDSKNQCMISEIGKPGERELHRKADKAASICSYVILEKNPLLVFELNKHEIFKNHDAVTSGMVHSYCGFPVRNKDGYAMGTFCIYNFSEVKEISPEKIELIEKLVSRLALQIDTQTEQKEITSQKISKSIDIFMENYKDFTLSDYKNFIDICSGLNLPEKNATNLINANLCEIRNMTVMLSSKGNELQEKMNIVTKIHNQVKVEGNEANSLIDNALDKLGDL
ncbi:GAF domain-containing protein [Alphaproteobacteria bacterium]|nr:GAF domain-containing protein [Alphaproteobacteria bacterium]